MDTDDWIAQKHDVAYSQNPNNVQIADERAVDEFINDWTHTGNWHSIIGGIGIQAKRTYENVFGQQYPMPHRGKQSYSQAIQQLGRLYQDTKKQGHHISWPEFMRLHFKDALKEAHGSTNGTGPTTSTGKRQQSDPDGDSNISKRTRTTGGEATFGNTVVSDITDSDFDAAMAAMDVDSMETLANPSKGGGVSGHSHRGGTTGNIVMIPRNIKTPYVHRTYKKNWIFFSYAFTNQQIKTNNDTYLTTPLSLIPVDYLPLYMDGSEYLALRGRCIVQNVKVVVKPLGCRMNFETSGTKSKWATSEFVAIGQAAIGLNTCCIGKNREYTPKTDNPMVIESTKFPDVKAVFEKLYGGTDGRGAIQMVPRHLNMYYTPITATPRDPAVTDTLFHHSNGPPAFDRYVDRFLINTCIGEPIINYTYKPKNGIISDVYSSDYINLTNAYRSHSAALEQQIEPDTVEVTPGTLRSREGFVKLSRKQDFDNATGWLNSFTGNISQTIEHSNTYSWDKGHIHGNVQPQVHVGLTAIPAINPGSEQTDFQNAAVYWSVETECTVFQYDNSVYHFGFPHTDCPNFYPPKYVKQYYSGSTFDHHANLAPEEQYSAIDNDNSVFSVESCSHCVGSMDKTGKTGFSSALSHRYKHSPYDEPTGRRSCPLETTDSRFAAPSRRTATFQLE